jgi:predicted RNA methylase
VGKNDLVYDLGCGDGRIVTEAARIYGCKARGYDIDPERIKESQETIKRSKVEHLVQVEKKDIFKLDLRPASVVTLYLLPELNVDLIPQLQKLRPGSRIVSHDFDMSSCRPEKVVRMVSEEDGMENDIFFWTIPFTRESKEEIFDVDDFVETSLKLPTPPMQPDVRQEMVRLVHASPKELVTILGCRDPLLASEIAKRFRCRVQCFDEDPKRIEASLEAAKKAAVGDLVQGVQPGEGGPDLKKTNVVLLDGDPKKAPDHTTLLKRMNRGARLVSRGAKADAGEPERTVCIYAKADSSRHVLYRWRAADED